MLRRTVLVGLAAILLGVVAAPARATAPADYHRVDALNTCVVYPTLTAALAGGGDPVIYVHGTVIESATTVIGTSIELEPSVEIGPGLHGCAPGSDGRIHLNPAVSDRILDVTGGTLILSGGLVVSGGDVVGDGGTIRLGTLAALVMRDEGTRVELGQATGRGGCIFADDSVISMEDGTSVGSCTSTGDGGGIGIVGGDAPYHVLRDVDDNASLGGHGGGVWADGAGVCIFDGRRNFADQDGGAVYLTDASGLAWLGAVGVFEDNSADGDGGAVSIHGPGSEMDLLGVLETNHADGHGGGIQADDEAEVCVNPGATVFSNSATMNGGGIHATSGSVVRAGDICDQVAVGWSASNPPPDDSPFVVLAGGHGLCDNVDGPITVSANLAGSDGLAEVSPYTRIGGGIYLGDAELDGSLIHPTMPLLVSGNNASHSGGGIAALDGSTVGVVHTTITDNEARRGNGGGLGAVDLSVVTVAGESAITDNYAASSGGGAYVLDADLDLTLEEDLRQNVAAAGHGGGVYAGGNAFVTLDATALEENDATVGDGGGLYAVGASSVTVTTATFVGNHAGGDGGGAAVGAQAQVTLGAAEFHDNAAGGDGGALALRDEAILTMPGGSVLIEGNSAVERGGGVAVRDDVQLTLEQPEIYDNTAEIDGGGIVAGGNAVVELLGGLVSSNLAETGWGGGLAMISAASVTTEGVWFHTNRAPAGSGGAIALRAGGADAPALVMLGSWAIPAAGCDHRPVAPGADEYCSEIRGNVADTGGGLAMEAGTAEVFKTAFLANEANDALAIELLDVAAPDLYLRNALVALHVEYGSTIIHVADDTNFDAANITVTDNLGTPIHLEPLATGNVFRSIVFDPNPVVVDAPPFAGDCTYFYVTDPVVGAFSGSFIQVGGGSPGLVTDPVRGMYRLSSTSSSVDKCVNGQPTDLDGNMRPGPASALPRQFDRGAFEHQ